MGRGRAALGVTQPESLLTLSDRKALGIDMASSPRHVPQIPDSALQGPRAGFEFHIPTPVLSPRQDSGC